MVVQMTKMLKSLLLNGIIPMHKMKVYHNDIKPQNLVNKNNKVNRLGFSHIRYS